jgi:hypothetical protein
MSTIKNSRSPTPTDAKPQAGNDEQFSRLPTQKLSELMLQCDDLASCFLAVQKEEFMSGEASKKLAALQESHNQWEQDVQQIARKFGIEIDSENAESVADLICEQIDALQERKPESKRQSGGWRFENTGCEIGFTIFSPDNTIIGYITSEADAQTIIDALNRPSNETKLHNAAVVEKNEAKDSQQYSDKLLCELWDKLGARGKIDEHESAVERIRDLIAKEDELQSLQSSHNEAVKAVEDSPYWLLRAAAEEFASPTCNRQEIHGEIRCSETSMCITEWCTPCALTAWLEGQRKAERALLDAKTKGQA